MVKYSWRLIPCMATALLFLGEILPSSLRADVLHKRGGGKLTGTIDKATSGASHVTIKTRYGTYKVAQDDVEKIEFEEKKVEDYKEKAKEFKETAEDQLKLALWCLENGHRDEYQQHLQKVIELDPNNGEARTRLGFQLVDGEWKTRDEYFEEMGYVKFRGEYVLPQEKSRGEEKREFVKEQREHFRNIRIWQKWLRQDREDRISQATDNLLKIDSEAAVKPLVDILGDKGTDSERYLLVDVLADIPGDISTDGLLLVALNDKVFTNRRHSVEVMTPRKSVRLLNYLAGVLKDNENSRVRNAAYALGELGDKTVVPALVDALVTTHRYEFEPTLMDQVRANSGTQFTRRTMIRPDGVMVRPPVRPPVIGGGVSVGAPPGKQIVVQEQQNQEVVDALAKLTGQNFGFNKGRWLDWVREEYHEKAAETAN